MGCNTSKESVQQAVEEAKEDAKEATKDLVRDLIGSAKKDEARNGDVPKSAGSPSVNDNLTTVNDSLKENSEIVQKQEENKDSDNRNKEVKAATVIQAIFRGQRVRKSMKNTGSSVKQGQTAEPEPTKEQLEQEFREDDKDLCHAATKIQATFRGHMSRKVDQAATAAKGLVESAAEKIEEKMAHAASELEGIDLSDPDLHKAATKIQASFRGHKVRQEVVIPNTDEKK